jgi:hypothetical protein
MLPFGEIKACVDFQALISIQAKSFKEIWNDRKVARSGDRSERIILPVRKTWRHSQNTTGTCFDASFLLLSMVFDHE